MFMTFILINNDKSFDFTKFLLRKINTENMLSFDAFAKHARYIIGIDNEVDYGSLSLPFLQIAYFNLQ